MLLRPFLLATAAVAAASFGVVASGEDPPETLEVVLKQGKIEGVRESIGESRFFYSFRGIPYAAPPVGDLRFQDPVPASEWTGVRKGMDPPKCPQLNKTAFIEKMELVVGDEDCLYLNLYKPTSHAGVLPVMVYIHGGGFFAGDADSLGGVPRPFLKKDIILISIQYRLGTLGFLSTGDSVMPGNLGLKDQTLALKWIQENVGRFGGDTTRITIFGESAGSASVHYQMISPYSKGLFQRAILQSGTALSPWAIRDDHRERAIKIAKDFDCLVNVKGNSPVDSNKLLQCFKGRSPEELVLAATKDTIWHLPIFMVPRIDGDYLAAHPAQLLREGKYHKVDLISGTCQNEAASVTLTLLGNETLVKEFSENFNQLGSLFTLWDNEINGPYLARRGMYHYVGDIAITEDIATNLEKFLGDISIHLGHDESTILHAHDVEFGKRIYRYELQHRTQLNIIDFLNITTEVAKSWVAHGDDVLLLFDNISGIQQSRDDDVLLANIMLDLWTNFARTGNPTPDMELGFQWEPMKSQDDLRYLSLVPAARMKEDNRAENREFLRNLPLKVNKALHPDRFTCTEDIC